MSFLEKSNFVLSFVVTKEPVGDINICHVFSLFLLAVEPY